jgi:hypothetical protein
LCSFEKEEEEGERGRVWRKDKVFAYCEDTKEIF